MCVWGGAVLSNWMLGLDVGQLDKKGEEGEQDLWAVHMACNSL